MSSKSIVWITVGVLTLPTPIMAADEFPYTLDLHFTEPSYLGCTEGTVSDGALRCWVLNPNGIDVGEFEPNFAWVVIGGVPDGSGPGAPGGIGGLQFGIEYDSTVDMTWFLCTGGTESPQADPIDGVWPDTGTGNDVRWPGGCYLVTDNPDGVTKVGLFILTQGSAGLIRVVEDPRIGQAHATACDESISRICRQAMGIGDATIGGGMGVATCGYLCAVPVKEGSWGSIRNIYSAD